MTQKHFYMLFCALVLGVICCVHSITRDIQFTIALSLLYAVAIVFCFAISWTLCRREELQEAKMLRLKRQRVREVFRKKGGSYETSALL
jgi:hypothetical protein